MLRDQEAYEFYKSGLTYREVGEKMGISRERARQLCVHYLRYKDNEIYIFMAPRFDRIFTGTIVNKLINADIQTIEALNEALHDNRILGAASTEKLRTALVNFHVQ